MKGEGVDDEHEKHLQLGADVSEDDRREMTDEEKERAWADSTDMEGFESGLRELAAEDGLTQWELARARREAGL